MKEGESFRISDWTFTILKSKDEAKERPFQIHVNDHSDKEQWWMDNGRWFKSEFLCYYAILLFLTENT
jgi:uncharacterized protein YukJ